MSHLTERLFEEAQDNPDSMLWKAASNIDRLTAENEALREEVERLREYDKQADFTRMNLLIEKNVKIENLEQERDRLKAAVALAIDTFEQYQMDVDTYPPVKHVALMQNLNGVLAKHDAEVIEQAAKPIATEFFRWWYNQPGSNTDQGFDEWWKLRQQEKEQNNG